METGFFETVRDAFEGFVAGVGGRRHVFVHSRGLKVWYDDATREHYESQLIRVDGEEVLEIGFHAEYPKAPLNDERRSTVAHTRAGVAVGPRRRRDRRRLHRTLGVATDLRGLATTGLRRR